MSTRVSNAARGGAYLGLQRLAGSRMPGYFHRYARMDQLRAYPDTGGLLAATLADAVANVPHYVGSADPGRIEEDPFGALAGFPILTREEIRAAGPALLSTRGNRRGWYQNTSGGSTGEPVTLIQDGEHLAQTVAIRDVYSTWAGGALGAPELYIWGSERDLLEGREQLRNRMGNWLLRRTLLNAFMLTEESMGEVVRCLQDGPPRLVIAYAQAAYEVARHISLRGLSIPPQVGLISTAGTLHGFMRDLLDETFGCVTLNRYGSRETGDMAGECDRRTGLHVLPWSCHVEVVDDRGEPAAPGQTGDVLVTSFINPAMPLIRYQIGDRATVADPDSPCPCGRQTQMLAAITGRTVDMFLGADGRMVDGEYFTHLLYFRDWLRQFQVAQTAPAAVEYRLVCDGEIPEDERQEVVAKTRSALGKECQVSFKLVDSIPPAPSGKLRYTIREF